MRALWGGWGQQEERLRAEAHEAGRDWQARANTRFVRQLASTWGRQRVHHANLCREMQRSRKAAFEQRRSTRQEAVRHLQEGFAAEQAESDSALLAARGVSRQGREPSSLALLSAVVCMAEGPHSSPRGDRHCARRRRVGPRRSRWPHSVHWTS